VAKVSFDFSLTDQSQIAQAVPPDIAPARKFPARVRVSQGVSTGLILTKVNPVYPADAKAAHVQGAVILHATISKEGSVEDLQLISGPSELVAATTKAVKQWRYRPYLLMGRPIPVDTQIQVNFTLSRP
jgi:protein TonB